MTIWIIGCLFIIVLMLGACIFWYKAGIQVGREQVLREDLIRLGVEEKTSNVNILDKMYDMYCKRVC